MIPPEVVPDGTLVVLAVPVAHPQQVGTAWAVTTMQIGDKRPELPSLDALGAVHLEIGEIIGRRMRAAEAAIDSIDAGTAMIRGGEITVEDLGFARRMRATEDAQAKLTADLEGVG